MRDLGAASPTVDAGPAPAAMPPPIAGSSVADCAESLRARGVGWCEIRGEDEPSIGAVFPELVGDEGRRIRMNVGPAAVLVAWNGAGYDEARGHMYFWGGGHNDYGGNEVYRFSFDDGGWERLSEPSPLDRLYVAADWGAREGKPWRRLCWMPDPARVPGASHSYDGLTYHPATETLFVSVYGAASGSCFEDEDHEFDDDPRVAPVRPDASVRWASVGLYEFNPALEARNGLAARSWRRVLDYDEFGAGRPGYPRSEAMPDGRLLVGPQHRLFALDPARPEPDAFADPFNGIADRGIGAVYYDRGRDVLWSQHRRATLRIDAATGENLQTITFSDDATTGAQHRMSLAVAPDGTLVSWDGFSTIYTLRPDEENPMWRRTAWGAMGPPEGSHQVYSKWVYAPDEGVFVGIATHRSGVWVYAHDPRLEL